VGRGVWCNALGKLSHPAPDTEENHRMKTLIAVALASLALLAAPAYAAGSCEAKAVSKDGKPLTGAAKTSFMKKCEADAGGAPSAACEKSAADKKLAGAAKTSHLKKCAADEMAAKK
jgi:hypothetical protein